MIERITDIPESELNDLIADYELFDYEIVRKFKQPDGLWTVEARPKSAAKAAAEAPAKPAAAAGEDKTLAALLSAPLAPPSPPAASPTGGITGLPEGSAILAIAARHVGQPYAAKTVDYEDANWRGAFDCAEYASYCAYRAYGILFGARPRKKGEIEAYTGYWRDDAGTFNAKTAWETALRIPGAFVLRYPPGGGQMGHIGICVGDGRGIYEAHSTNKGVILGVASGRRWDTGVLLPGVTYARPDDAISAARVPIYRLRDPVAGHDPVVERFQSVLAGQGHLAKTDVHGVYDRATYDAVVAFQQKNGLVVDGEVGPSTGVKLLGDFDWNALQGQVGAAIGPAIAAQDLLTMARTIYGEARGEPNDGREAVGHVVMNRVRSPRYPNRIADVCLQAFQFSCWNKNDPNYPKIRAVKPGDDAVFDACYGAAERVIKGLVADPTGGAMHYHATSIAPPNWVTKSRQAKVTAEIGAHRFYTGIL